MLSYKDFRGLGVRDEGYIRGRLGFRRFRVHYLSFRVQGLGLRCMGLGLYVSGFLDQGMWLGVTGLEIIGLGFRVQG